MRIEKQSSTREYVEENWCTLHSTLKSPVLWYWTRNQSNYEKSFTNKISMIVKDHKNSYHSVHRCLEEKHEFWI